jgi:hypothetical protein
MRRLHLVPFLILLLALVAHFAAPANAALRDGGPAQPTSVEELFVKAIQYGGFEEACRKIGGCQMPGVLIAAVDDKNIAGRFSPREPNVITVSADVWPPGSVWFNAVLIHEFTHYLQWETGVFGPNTPCSRTYEIEEPAYKAGSRYLAEFGIDEKFADQLQSIAIMSAMCGASELDRK